MKRLIAAGTIALFLVGCGTPSTDRTPRTDIKDVTDWSYIGYGVYTTEVEVNGNTCIIVRREGGVGVSCDWDAE